MKQRHNKNHILLAALLLSLALFAGCAQQETDSVDYAAAENWAYHETERTDTAADVFFVCPTVYAGAEDAENMPLDNADAKADFLGATNMEKGIYDADSRFFAPYYRQASLYTYSLPENERTTALSAAYEDIKDAFEYYLANDNDGRPIILAGFSQGGDLVLRLLQDYFDDDALADQLVACYAIGWRVTEDQLAEHPHMRFATGEADTGVIVSFNSEAPEVTDSLVIPSGSKTLAINPLNWRTDSIPADKSQNLGACFTDYDGNITEEIPQLTGAYIDDQRGALKVPDVSPENYPAGLSIFSDGIYHLYDYQFFYRNLQDNVATRLNAYLAETAQNAAA